MPSPSSLALPVNAPPVVLSGPAVMKMNSFLGSFHPAYEEQREEWELNLRRARGGLHVLRELVPFIWELPEGEQINERKQMAVYLNFPDRFASILAGHLMRAAPAPGASLDFGTLGDVRRRRDIDEPTPAELFYYNTNGIGKDGSQWNNCWTQIVKGAVTMGHRWLLLEGPQRGPRNRLEEIQGLRPYLTNYGPLSVTNWAFQNGQLVMAIIKRRVRRLRIDDGRLQGNAGEVETLLLTAEGFNGFGAEYSDGGWYSFDQDGEMTDFGFYEQTEGQIPMTMLAYDRLEPEGDYMAISRSGTTEMSQAAIAYMNLASAADFDAWDGASSVQALMGVDEESFNVFIRKVKEGSRYAPVKANMDSGNVPQIHDMSTGVVVADVFDRRLKLKRQEAVELMLNEIEAAPYASGESKQVSFTDAKVPRLTLLAAETESAQNTIIHFAELMWGRPGTRPQGATEWNREFDLRDLRKEISEFFSTVTTARLRSPTAETKAMVTFARKLGIVGDTEELSQVEAEYRDAAESAAKKEKEAPVPGAGGAPSQNGGASQ